MLRKQNLQVVDANAQQPLILLGCLASCWDP
jgi:hypothetical protein